MKATLEFTLPEERDEYEHTTKAVSYYISLCEIREYIRSKLKYEENLDKKTEKYLTEIAELIIDIPF